MINVTITFAIRKLILVVLTSLKYWPISSITKQGMFLEFLHLELFTIIKGYSLDAQIYYQAWLLKLIAANPNSVPG